MLGEEELLLALTPGETSQLSKAEIGSKGELERGEAQGIFCWQTPAVRSAVGMGHSFHVVCVRYAVDTQSVSSV